MIFKASFRLLTFGVSGRRCLDTARSEGLAGFSRRPWQALIILRQTGCFHKLGRYFCGCPFKKGHTVWALYQGPRFFQIPLSACSAVPGSSGGRLLPWDWRATASTSCEVVKVGNLIFCRLFFLPSLSLPVLSLSLSVCVCVCLSLSLSPSPPPRPPLPPPSLSLYCLRSKAVCLCQMRHGIRAERVPMRPYGPPRPHENHKHSFPQSSRCLRRVCRRRLLWQTLSPGLAARAARGTTLPQRIQRPFLVMVCCLKSVFYSMWLLFGPLTSKTPSIQTIAYAIRARPRYHADLRFESSGCALILIQRRWLKPALARSSKAWLSPKP